MNDQLFFHGCFWFFCHFLIGVVYIVTERFSYSGVITWVAVLVLIGLALIFASCWRRGVFCYLCRVSRRASILIPSAPFCEKHLEWVERRQHRVGSRRGRAG